MVQSIVRSKVTGVVFVSYQHSIAFFPRILLAHEVLCVGLFAGEDVGPDQYLIEYTGNRVRAGNTVIMHRALDRLDMEPDVLVDVDKGMLNIDRRCCGNHGMTINPSCNPTAQLLETKIGGKIILLIQTSRTI